MISITIRTSALWKYTCEYMKHLSQRSAKSLPLQNYFLRRKNSVLLVVVVEGAIEGDAEGEVMG